MSNDDRLARILVLDDEAPIRDLVRQMLGRYRYEVVEARNALECLTLISGKDPFDLLLTDLVMPGLNGRQISELVAATGRDIRVLYMSGYTENAAANHHVFDEGVHFIAKPFTETMLVEAVRRALEEPSGVLTPNRG